MSISISWSSVLSKAKDYMESGGGKRQKDKAISDFVSGKSSSFFQGTSGSGAMSPDVAGDIFVNILIDEIRKSVGSDYSGGDIGADIADAIAGSIVRSVVYRDGPHFAIDIYFDMNKYRPSLSKRSEPLENVIAALNAGWDTQYNVRGFWHGKRIKSLNIRDGAGFIQNAVARFERQYGTISGLIRIEYPEYETDWE